MAEYYVNFILIIRGSVGFAGLGKHHDLDHLDAGGIEHPATNI
jgi:hypothetical protein